MDLETKTRNYFTAFANKDLEKLSEIFSPNISLKDWNLSAHGRPAVLEANAKIFDDIEKINIDVQHVYIAGFGTIIAELLITADDQEPLPVVDIINWSTRGPVENRKITSITAYRGN